MTINSGYCINVNHKALVDSINQSISAVSNCGQFHLIIKLALKMSLDVGLRIVNVYLHMLRLMRPANNQTLTQTNRKEKDNVHKRLIAFCFVADILLIHLHSAQIY